MTPKEIQKIVELTSSLGIRKVKLTGGEPLVRKDIIEILNRINTIPIIEETSMTTNGILLEKHAEDLKHSGLARVNVSLDTLKEEKFEQITGKHSLHHVINGLKKAVNVGLFPVKVNMVLLKGVNENEVPDMVDFVSSNRLVLQIIEYESPYEDKM